HPQGPGHPHGPSGRAAPRRRGRAGLPEVHDALPWKCPGHRPVGAAAQYVRAVPLASARPTMEATISAPEERVINDTSSLCRTCKNVIPATVVATMDGEVWMRKRCGDHG